MKPRRLILQNSLSPGDIIMLTAAVRDLHLAHPKRFVTDVRTTARELWENNRFISRLEDDDPAVEKIQCEYPLINRSNTSPFHFIHGFPQFLSKRLGVDIPLTDFKGDIHLSKKEKSWISQVAEITKQPIPFWIIGGGGKHDFTIKLWDFHRYQEVVDKFQGRILFVQVGQNGHHHPPLRGALDLRGMTDMRQMVRLMYHAQGVLCGVTMLMHLAAAVETKPGMPKNRACVVIAGGREPSQWEAYPHHQYIHTNGMLWCCANGGCWKARIVPIGDGDEKDQQRHLCQNVVMLQWPPDAGQDGAAIEPVTSYYLPRCMDMITSQKVGGSIEGYFEGGACKYLTPEEAVVAARAIAQWNARN